VVGRHVREGLFRIESVLFLAAECTAWSLVALAVLAGYVVSVAVCDVGPEGEAGVWIVFGGFAGVLREEGDEGVYVFVVDAGFSAEVVLGGPIIRRERGLEDGRGCTLTEAEKA
jgi:hypothetical protein